ncbi:hypothetical protein NHX12_029509 [Muraenolepis orangiensis]|uniref:Zinc transporter ZIP6 n=1 Tax=Muraenolepis orangiensis TaxID=630683 RepID=A0A9Q0EA30_9TELE|nr:hypothetical protein NHX12_029509 [Muraenolepis orangiensis]
MTAEAIKNPKQMLNQKKPGHESHRHNHSHHSDHEDNRGGGGRSVAMAWAGGFVSITLISLLSLLGVVLIPLMNKVFFNFLLSFLVALAVGMLSGDAFLHLIPHITWYSPW